MKRRGQLLSEPFVFVFALIVGAMILIWGMYYVLRLNEVGESVELTSFVNTLRKDVESYYYLDEGSSKLITIKLPGKIDFLCVKGEGQLNNNEILNKYPGFDFILENNDKNVFFAPINAYRVTIYNIENLKPAGKNPLCFKNNEKAKLTTKSNYVEISSS